MWGPVIADEEAISVFEEPLSLELLTPGVLLLDHLSFVQV